MRMQRTLILMVKEPKPGRVKTRLGRDIGMTAAAWWFRHQSLAIIRRLRDPRWTIVLAVSPDAPGLTSRVWPGDLTRVAQRSGHLGRRMGRLIRQAPPGPACVIGVDIPGVQKHHISRAFALLGSHQAVFGPATDGGYWLVGLNRTRAMPPMGFENVRWSTKHALNDSIRSLPGLRVALADTLSDVDTIADLPVRVVTEPQNIAFANDATSAP